MCGALKRARLVKVGVAEVVFVRKEDAVSAYRKYNNRCLDGECQWQGRPHQMSPWVLFWAFGFCFTCRSMTTVMMTCFAVKDVVRVCQTRVLLLKVTEGGCRAASRRLP